MRDALGVLLDLGPPRHAALPAAPDLGQPRLAPPPPCVAVDVPAMVRVVRRVLEQLGDLARDGLVGVRVANRRRRRQGRIADCAGRLGQLRGAGPRGQLARREGGGRGERRGTHGADEGGLLHALEGVRDGVVQADAGLAELLGGGGELGVLLDAGGELHRGRDGKGQRHRLIEPRRAGARRRVDAPVPART